MDCVTELQLNKQTPKIEPQAKGMRGLLKNPALGGMQEKPGLAFLFYGALKQPDVFTLIRNPQSAIRNPNRCPSPAFPS
jgi:hypothetical protein